MSGKTVESVRSAPDLAYFVQWRPWLWCSPVAHALEFLGDLQGKRVLEIGGRSGHMTSLLALRGAHVTMLERGDLTQAAEETARWGVSDRVRLIRTSGGFDAIAGETFDAIFTKSVLWSIEHLAEFLDQLEPHLAQGGKVAFVENYRGGGLLMWLRRNIVRRHRFEYESRYFGITPEQIGLFEKRFGGLTVRRRRYFVYEIFGHKKPSRPA
jgi:protein-L-isoaspartate O-methyltransferase